MIVSGCPANSIGRKDLALSLIPEATLTVIKYILNQEEHHRKKTFKEEYIDFLKKYEIKYDEKYLFEWIE